MAKYYTLKEVAEMLAVNERTIRTWMRRKQIPFTQLAGYTVRFNKAETDRWIAERSHKASDEVAIEAAQ